MSFQVNTPIAITHDDVTTNYIIYSKHRGQPTDEISIWSIDFEAEVSCFFSCYTSSWYSGRVGWSCIWRQGHLLNLGHNLKNDHLVIAKFVENQNNWHGYPADIRNKPADKPLPAILSNWMNQGIVSKSLMVRIKQGQL